MKRAPSSTAAPRVGYVLKRFPRLSETFVLNEILELERQGTDVEIFSLLRPPPEPHHALLDRLRARVWYMPEEIVSASLAAGPASVDEIVGPRLGQLGALFAGKTSEAVARLHLKAANVAMLAAALGVEHLHAHFASDATRVALLAGRLARLPFSFTAHARDIYNVYVDRDTDDLRRRQSIAEAKFVVTVSDCNVAHLRQVARLEDAGRVRRLYNGVDLARFQPGGEMREPGLFLAVGRLIKKKGYPDLIEACRLLRDQGARFRCAIVGDGPLRPVLSDRIDELGLEREVDLMGAQPQEAVIALMGRATALVLPAMLAANGDRDGLPTVLLEALASGLPAISTELGGIPEIIDHEVTGLLVQPQDPRSLSAAMARLLADPTLAEMLAQNGRAKAAAVFDLRRNVAELRRLFADRDVRRMKGSRAAAAA